MSGIGQSIVVTSGKGGTGKTTCTAAIASCLAGLGRRVLVIDGDIGLRNLDLVLGMNEQVPFDYNDVIQGRCTLNDAIVSHRKIKRLSLLAAPMSIMPGDIEPQVFRAIMRAVKPFYDYVLIDCAAGLDTAFQLAAGAAESAILVANTELVSLRDAARTHQLLREMNITDCRLIINRLRPHQIKAGEAANIDEAMDIAGLPLLGLVPEDETVIACANHTTPLVLQGKTAAGLAFLNIAKRIDGQTVQLPKKIKSSPSRFVMPKKKD